MYPAETEALECFFNNASTHTSQQTQKLRNTDDDGKMQHSLKRQKKRQKRRPPVRISSRRRAEETSKSEPKSEPKRENKCLALVHILQVKTGGSVLSALGSRDKRRGGGLCYR